MKQSNMNLWKVHNSWSGNRYIFATTAASAAKKVHSWNVKQMRENCKAAGEPYVPVEPIDRVELVAEAKYCLVEE